MYYISTDVYRTSFIVWSTTFAFIILKSHYNYCHIISALDASLLYWYYGLYIFMCTTMCGIPLIVFHLKSVCKCSSNILKNGSKVVKIVVKVKLGNSFSVYCNSFLEITDQCLLYTIGNTNTSNWCPCDICDSNLTTTPSTVCHPCTHCDIAICIQFHLKGQHKEHSEQIHKFFVPDFD